MPEIGIMLSKYLTFQVETNITRIDFMKFFESSFFLITIGTFAKKLNLATLSQVLELHHLANLSEQFFLPNY
jgi:hypothetical protein